MIFEWHGEVWQDHETGEWFVCTVVDDVVEEHGPFRCEELANAVILQVAAILRIIAELIAERLRR